MFKKKVPEQPLEFVMLDQEDFTCFFRVGVIHAVNLGKAFFEKQKEF